MSFKKTVYSRSELFKIRDAIALEADGQPHDATPALPTFRASSSAGAEGGTNAAGGFGSWRDGVFGASNKSGEGGGSRRPSSQALHQSPSGSDLSIPHQQVRPVQWVYRTTGGSTKSNPMSLKEIEQLVLDELVDADEIELSRFGSGPELFLTLAEAVAAPQTASVPMEPDGSSCSPIERWRPGSGATGDRRQLRALQGPSARPASGGAQHSHLPPKHLSISRDEMLGVEDLRRRSPCAVTPPSTSPSASVILPAPIDVGAVALDEHLGLGTVPTPSGHAQHPPPQPPCALDAGADALGAISPSGRRIAPKPAAEGTPTKLRPPPPPILCVDEPQTVSTPAAVPVVPVECTATAVLVAVCEDTAPQGSLPEKIGKAKSQSRSPGKKQQRVEDSQSQGADDQNTATTKKGSKTKADKKRTVGPTPLPPAVIEEQPVKQVHVDPAIIAHGRAVPSESAAAAPKPPAKVEKKRGEAGASKKQEGGAAAAWGTNEQNSKASNNGNKQARRSKQSSPADPQPPGVDPCLYPTLEEVLRGDVKPAKPVVKQQKTLASIVAEGRGNATAALPVAAQQEGKGNQSNQQQQPNKKASAGRGGK